MNIERVYAALQRDTHLTDRQMWREFPEFMRLHGHIVFEKRLQQIYDDARAVRLRIASNYDQENRVPREAGNDTRTS